MKKYLSSAPILVAPRPQEPLLLYLAGTNQVVSTALVAQREVDDEVMAATEPGTTNAETTQPVEVPPKKKMMQHPVYCVSSLLQGARSRYSGVQKLLFGLLMASRKLRHYFLGARNHCRHSPPSATDIAQSRCNGKNCGMGTGVVQLWPQV